MKYFPTWWKYRIVQSCKLVPVILTKHYAFATKTYGKAEVTSTLDEMSDQLHVPAA
jgi:hypothetical protein